MTPDSNSMICLDCSSSGPFTSIFYFLKILFIYFWLCQVFFFLSIKFIFLISLFTLIGGFIVVQRLSLLVESGHYSLVAVHGLLIAMASLVADHTL